MSALRCFDLGHTMKLIVVKMRDKARDQRLIFEN